MHSFYIFSTVAGQNVFWGRGNLAERDLGEGGPGEKKTLKIFEFFIPEIASNASDLKKKNSSIVTFCSPST